MNRWTIGWLLILIVLALAGCGGDDTSDPSGSQDPRAEAERQAGFPVILPSSLPTGVRTSPEISVIVGTRVDIDYARSANSIGPQAPIIQITEQPLPIQRGGPSTTKTLAGVSVRWAEAPGETGNMAAVDAVWQQGAIYVSALFTWGDRLFPVTLTDEMRQVAEDVITSIISSSESTTGATTTSASTTSPTAPQPSP